MSLLINKQHQPPPPPPPPPPPGPKSKSGIPKPPPPPPPSAPLSEKDLKVKKAREKMVDRIKKAARARPDWKSVMKDIELNFY
ncbi:hypothetical protein Avbf_02985 [Armadillidium vulgare]|nr:hypothetical protein Avbf_02985 [Armadillidium vulgare]